MPGIQARVVQLNANLPPSHKKYTIGTHLLHCGIEYLICQTDGGLEEVFRDKPGKYCLKQPIAAGRRFGAGRRRHETWRRYFSLTVTPSGEAAKVNFHADAWKFERMWWEQLGEDRAKTMATASVI